MTKSRYDAILNFPKYYLNHLNDLNYLVILSTRNTEDNFCFLEEPLFSQNSNLFWGIAQ